MALLHIVALDDLVDVHRADAGTTFSYLMLLPPVCGSGGRQPRGPLVAEIDFDRDRDEGKADLSAPAGTSGHDVKLLKIVTSLNRLGARRGSVRLMRWPIPRSMPPLSPSPRSSRR